MERQGMMNAIDIRTQGTLRAVLLSLALVVGFAALTSVGALVRIPLPFTPVPVTLQTLMVLLAGAMIGPMRGALSQALYVAWGASGLPLFAGATSGLAILAGPTGGYLVGFALAAAYVGWALPRTTLASRQFLVFSAGTGIILLVGWLHLSLLFAGGDFGHGLTLGVLPFLPGAAIKIIAATSIWRAWTVLRDRNTDA